MFVDHIKVQAFAGRGGHGCVSFRREAFVPKGGPDGGDGGRGASIILRADVHVDNLTMFFYEPLLKAQHGQQGMGKQCSGKSAEDRVYNVPVGTLVYRMPAPPPVGELEASVRYGTDSTFVDLERSPEDEEKEVQDIENLELELVVDLKEPGQEFVLCRGGKGGLGNVHFKSSRNRVPTQFTYGEEGEEGAFYLELRKIADVGLVGYPNAGKSTLLGAVSAAHPKVAAYPFTTLTPHIGVVELAAYQRFTVADIPGLIEGAHLDVGLGHEFLRHILRCKLLAFVVDTAGSEGRDPVSDIQSLRREVSLYDAELAERPWVIIANKMDLPGAAEMIDALRFRFARVEILQVEAASGEGIAELKERLGAIIKSHEAASLNS
jgi:GTP-binding protein